MKLELTPPQRAWLRRAGLWLGRLLLILLGVVLVVIVARLVFQTDTGVKASDWLIRLLQASGWQIVTLLALLLILGTPGGSRFLSGLLARTKKVSAFGVELELTQEAAVKVDPAFDEYRRRINREFDRQVHTRQIDALAGLVVDDALRDTYGKRIPREYRATIHVQDVLFEDALYQLLDYYPTGPGRGRAFSMRYGIIGRTWRFLKDQVEVDLDVETKNLVELWGMTQREAAARSGPKSFVCALLQDENKLPVGIFYFDSTVGKAFGMDEAKGMELARNARERSHSCGLTRAISELGQEMRKVGPSIRVFT